MAKDDQVGRLPDSDPDGSAPVNSIPVMMAELDRARDETQLLIAAGRALSSTRDLNKLLERILTIARRVTRADAGSVFVVHSPDSAPNASEPTLHFRTAQNDSRSIETEGFVLAIDRKSIVGACALARKQICIDDLYKLGPPGSDDNPWGFIHNRAFDEKHDYQTRSILALPMLSARGDTIGVIQLINRRKRSPHSLPPSANAHTPTATPVQNFDQEVIPFDQNDIDLANVLSAQAGIALENALLYLEVQNLFESFVGAAVTAIESRDPTTSGHSRRVSDFTLGLAKATEKHDAGSYRDLCFSADQLKEIEYASLLHDFGKVGVREHVLVKANKLYEHEKELIIQRFAYARIALEKTSADAKIKLLLEDRARPSIEKDLAEIDNNLARDLEQLDRYLNAILSANRPTVLEDGDFQSILELAERNYPNHEGPPCPLLTTNQAMALQVRRGSLTAQERKEIESHVVHTYNFLKQIPWGNAYSRVPEIAGAHHEKLSGEGYPRGLGNPDIAVEARMMTICDIYDALTASDRPYKKAIPREKALDILNMEEKSGSLDRELLDIFIAAKVYELPAALTAGT